MAPTAIRESDPAEVIATLKANLSSSIASTGYSSPHPAPIADNFMYEYPAPPELPTVDRLGARFPSSADAVSIAETWLSQLSSALTTSDSAAFADLFITDGVWRDRIAFTWEYRSFNGHSRILSAASDLLPVTPVSNIKLIAPTPEVSKPYPDLEWVQVSFSFDTDKVGGSGVANLVQTQDGVKAWFLNTAVESLHGFPELPNRDGHMVGDLSWPNQRLKDISEVCPDVVIIGGGHNGLMMAGRLKALGVPTLIIERNARIGDNWRGRYEALSLHFPHWADHFPYMPYPQHWPVYTPAAKLGDWLEWYASAQELYAWTGSSVKDVKQDEAGQWTIKVDRGGEGERVLRPKHVVMATSLAGVPMMPTVPGAESFKGTIRHSTEHDSSRAWVGKRVLVVGTSSSGFDTAYDFARRGIDVTILQRSPTYIMSLTNSVPKFLGLYKPDGHVRPDLDTADRLAYAMPVGPAEPLGRRGAQELAELDRDLLEGMESRGFKTWLGQRGTGVQTLGYTKNGGFYFDAGACEQIINGNIKVEQGWIDHFTEDKVVLNGDREDTFDLVIMATGFTNTISSVRATLGSEIASRVGPIWGMDKEGELNSAWKDCGVPNLWIMVGTLQHGRYHSKRVALRIKAMLEGIANPAYKA